MGPRWQRVLAVLLLAQQLAAGASHVIHRNLAAAAAAPTGDNFQPPPRKWMEGTTAAGEAVAPFCGSAAGYRCSVEDEKKLREAFLAEMKAHGYHDAGCKSELKAYICAVYCLPSAPAAAEPFSNTNSSLLPLRCAGAPSVVSIHNHDLTSPSSEPPAPWPFADDNKAPRTTPKLLIVALSALATLFGGFVTYKICKAKLECCNNNHCCTNIRCCLCLL